MVTSRWSKAYSLLLRVIYLLHICALRYSFLHAIYCTICIVIILVYQPFAEAHTSGILTIAIYSHRCVWTCTYRSEISCNNSVAYFENDVCKTIFIRAEIMSVEYSFIDMWNVSQSTLCRDLLCFLLLYEVLGTLGPTTSMRKHMTMNRTIRCHRMCLGCRNACPRYST